MAADILEQHSVCCDRLPYRISHPGSGFTLWRCSGCGDNFVAKEVTHG